MGTTQAPSVEDWTTWLREISRNINQGLTIPVGSYGCVIATPSILRVSLNIHEDLTNMAVDWLGTAATVLDMKCRVVHSGDACT